jgi:hypothetical protein
MPGLLLVVMMQESQASRMRYILSRWFSGYVW